MPIAPPFAAPPEGLQDKLQALATTVARILQTRGALFALELHEEIHRRKQALLLAVLAVASLHMALLGVTALLVTLFWDTHRVAAIAALTAVYLACALALGLALRARLARFPAPFEATMAEFGRDILAVGSTLP